jgi:hypothetical protein
MRDLYSDRKINGLDVEAIHCLQLTVHNVLSRIPVKLFDLIYLVTKK